MLYWHPENTSSGASADVIAGCRDDWVVGVHCRLERVHVRSSFTFDTDHQTIPVGIANFTDLYFIPWGDIAAASVIVTLPLVALVLIFERHIIAGLTQAGVKA